MDEERQHKTMNAPARDSPYPGDDAGRQGGFLTDEVWEAIDLAKIKVEAEQ
jgi:hypothetical protein